MKTILQKLISSSTTIIRHLFPSSSGRQEIKTKLNPSHLKEADKLCRSIVKHLKGNADFPLPPAYGKDVKMLHRRLAQLQRLKRQGSAANRAEALKKLTKEWKRYQRNRSRKIKGETGKIIPISSEPKK